MSLILIVSLTLHIGSYPVNAEPDITHPQQPSTPVTPVFPPVNTNTVVSSHADHPMIKQENVSLTNNPDSKPNNCK